MSKTGLFAVVALLAGALPAPAQTPAPAPTDAQIKGQAPDRGRPTKHDDEQPLLDFDTYFLGGPWSFEWDVPEGPLGQAGRITGTTTYKALGGKYYEATTQADGPDGKYTVTEVIGYQCSPGPEAETWDLHLIETDGTSLRQLTHVAPGQRLWNPTWTPDGSRITAGFEDTRLGVWVDPTTGAIEPFPTTQLMSRPRLRPIPTEGP